MINHVKDLQDLNNFAVSFLSSLFPCESRARIILLSGDLGVGKTAFVKFCASYFNILDDITSPTFVIQKEYNIDDSFSFSKLIHIDAYRLETSRDLEYLGWNEIIKNPKNIIFVEWPKQVKGIDIDGAIHIFFTIKENNERDIEIKK